MKERITATLLGGFAMRRQDYTMTEQASTSKRLWAFLEYLTIYHQRPVTQEELIEALWGDMEDIDPGNTLKTLLYRARSAMETYLGFPNGKEVILYRRGVYRWNEDIELVLDIERFDEACAQPVEQSAERQMEAIRLYQGDLIPNAAGNPWTVSLRTYYHTRFLKLCGDLSGWLIRQKRYDQAQEICRRATELDPYDETCHMMLMQALAKSGQQQTALRHYVQMANMFMDQLGISPSEQLTQLYRELSEAEQDVELDLFTIRQGLQEQVIQGGPLFCEYNTFQNIYRLEARSAKRSGRIVQLAVISIFGENGDRLESKRCSLALSELRNTIHHCLRAGDVFTRFSASQLLILLPTASHENGIKALQRIIDAYQSTIMGMTTSISFSLLPVLPMGEELADQTGFAPVGRPG